MIDMKRDSPTSLNKGYVWHQSNLFFEPTKIKAIDGVHIITEANKKRDANLLVVALDIENALNAAWYPALVLRLKLMGVSCSISGILSDFLTNISVNGAWICREAERGCPQRFSFGPVLWLVLIEKWYYVVSSISITHSARMNRLPGVCLLPIPGKLN